MHSNKEKPEITFLVFYSSIFHCGPWRNSVHLWAERNFKVNVFQLSDANLHKHRSALDDEYTLHEISISYWVYIVSAILNRGFGLFRFVGLKRLSAFGRELGYLLKSFYFVLACYRKIDKKKNRVLIGGDPQGLLAAYLISRLKGNMLIYWSLELWIEKDIKKFGCKVFKKIERWCNQRTQLTIEFGEKRCELLRKENRLDGRSMISIPNSPLGNAKAQRNRYFNHRFNIPLNKKIVLYAGGLYDDLMVREVLESVNNWPANCVLVLHGRMQMAYAIQLQEQIERQQLNVYLSSDMVPYEQIGEIYSSADIGLNFLELRITNFRYADLSTGKLFHYLKWGLPVIVNDLVGYRQMVEGNGFGVCIKRVSETGSAISRILQHESSYKDKALKAFKKFNFEQAHKKLIHEIARGFA